MAITPYPARPTPEPHLRRSLGKVLVTIDDLQALLDILHQHELVTDEVVVQCDEGLFTDAADMRRLSDQTLRRLRIEVNGLVIHLSEDSAEAFGPPPLVEHVDRSWARLRQIRRRSPRGRAAVGTSLVGMGLFGAVGVAVAVGQLLQRDEQSISFAAAVVVLLALAAAYYIRLNRREGRQDHWAHIRPLTRQEIREREESKTPVPAWALLVSVLALLVSLIFNVLNYTKAN